MQNAKHTFQTEILKRALSSEMNGRKLNRNWPVPLRPRLTRVGHLLGEGNTKEGKKILSWPAGTHRSSAATARNLATTHLENCRVQWRRRKQYCSNWLSTREGRITSNCYYFVGCLYWLEVSWHEMDPKAPSHVCGSTSAAVVAASERKE